MLGACLHPQDDLILTELSRVSLRLSIARFARNQQQANSWGQPPECGRSDDGGFVRPELPYSTTHSVTASLSLTNTRFPATTGYA
jgi:hypothetical protein